MAAQRLGLALSNLIGTSKQQLKVKADESGFEFFSPASLPTYTLSNVTTDREFNANDTNVDEFADVLGTLISDIDTATSGGSNIFSAFQWSSSEQVWPFEKASNGATLYCKEINFGSMPNNGVKSVAHGISNLNPGVDIFSMNVNERIFSYYYWPVPNCSAQGGMPYSTAPSVYQGNISIYNGYDASAYTAIVRLIYKKSG